MRWGRGSSGMMWVARLGIRNAVLDKLAPLRGAVKPLSHWSTDKMRQSADLVLWSRRALAQLSQLEGKGEQNQQGSIESLHYKTGTWVRADLCEDVMRGGDCGGKSSFS